MNTLEEKRSEELPDWVDFALGEDVRDERRQEQDRLWAQAIADGRSHFSNRETALEFAPQFTGSINSFTSVLLLLDGLYCRRSPLSKIDDVIVHMIVEYAFPGQGILVPALAYRREMVDYVNKFFAAKAKDDQSFRICLRKRPLFQFELAQGCYDVARVMGKNEIILHEGKLARNGRLLSMTHHRFLFDRVFSEFDDNAIVCAETIQPLLEWSIAGNSSTLLCFGQTGTGKTHTLYGALQYLAQHLQGHALRLTFYEVHGNKCYDLLNDRQVVHLRFDHNEQVHVRGANVAFFPQNRDIGQLKASLDSALRLRASTVTERNPVSSRSHAVCVLELMVPDEVDPTDHSLAAHLRRTDPTHHEGFKPAGKITLVDLAGSERNYETTQMTAIGHRESAAINLTLMSLKNCFRAHHMAITSTSGSSKQIRIPYRASTLTKVLKDCFSTDRKQHTVIMATISPSPVDLQHSINSAQHVLLMSPSLPSPDPIATVEVPKSSYSALSNVPIAQWTNEQVMAWLVTCEHGRFAHLVLPPGMDGAGLLQLSAVNFTDLFERQEQAARQENEGPSWVISTEETSRLRAIGQALYVAVHREELHSRTLSE